MLLLMLLKYQGASVRHSHVESEVSYRCSSGSSLNQWGLNGGLHRPRWLMDFPDVPSSRWDEKEGGTVVPSRTAASLKSFLGGQISSAWGLWQLSVNRGVHWWTGLQILLYALYRAQSASINLNAREETLEIWKEIKQDNVNGEDRMEQVWSRHGGTHI